MARSLAGFLVLLLFVSICEAASLFQPISDFDRSAALELFAPDHHGYFKSLEETYEALRTFQILGIEKKPYKTATVCRSILETIGSSSSTPKDLFYALKANSIAECKINEKAFQGIITRLKAALYVASSLFDFYYSIGGLVLIKDQSSKADVDLAEAEGVFRSVKDHSSKADVDLAEATGDFHSVKALGQSDGRWRSSSNSPESSAFAAGIALETLAGTVSLASSKHDQSSKIGSPFKEDWACNVRDEEGPGAGASDLRECVESEGVRPDLGAATLDLRKKVGSWSGVGDVAVGEKVV